jgi:ectoine hydroxylase-related dioxygenase (phytanoyl-CoA dioxygenase family)
MTDKLQSIRALGEEYRRDGAILIPGVLDQVTLAEAQRDFEWSIANPSSSSCEFYEDDRGTFYQDLCNPQAAHNYRSLLESSILSDMAAALWGSDNVWFLYEQVFLKEGEATRRTPWHQDSPYLALEGTQIAVVWINFDPVEQAQSLEFVRGSHLRTLYDGSAFDPDDDTKPIYDMDLPRLPDIESDRKNYDILSWAVNPGDVVVFHPSTLHGGSPTVDGIRRRTLSLRFFGDDAVYAERPMPAPAPLVAGLHDSLNAGDAFRHRAFPKLRPTPHGFENIPELTNHEQSLKAQIQRG